MDQPNQNQPPDAAGTQPNESPVQPPQVPDENTAQTPATPTPSSTQVPEPVQINDNSSGVDTNTQPPIAQPVTPPVSDNQPQTDTPAPDATQETPVKEPINTYTQNVGGNIIDVLTDISLDEKLQQKIAETMKISTEQLNPILDGLLNKIDNEQVTVDELALILTCPVADEEPKQEQSST